MNRELPHDLANFAKQECIPLFPSSWRDFPMDCSCPDYAVPCKHLAAVIYIIANEIDKNPFLVFQLHGFDIMTEVEKRFSGGKKPGIRVATYLEFFDKKSAPAFEIDENVFDSIDFSEISPLSEKLLKIIQPNPIFSEKDFKKNLEKAHKLIAKEAGRYVVLERNAEIEDFHFGDEIQLCLTDENDVDKLTFISPNGEERNHPDVSFEKLKNTLFLSDDKYFDRMSDSTRILKKTHQFCLTLLANGAIIPQLLKTENEKYLIRWLPAINNETVKQLLSLLAKAMPSQLLIFENKKTVYYQLQEEQILTLCSLFLNNYVGEFTASMGDFFRGKVSYDTWDAFFFQQQPLQFKKFGEKETPVIIQSWLNNYYISQKEFIPILRIEEGEHDDFTMDILVDKRGGETAPVELVKIISKKKYESIWLEVLQDLLLLANHFPALDEYLQKQGKERMLFGSEEFVSVLLDVLPTLQLFGIQILLPKSLKHWIKPQVSGKINSKSKADGKSFLQLENMLSFDWEIAMGDELLSWDEFEKLTRGMKGLVKIKDQFVWIEESELDKLRKKLENPPKLSGNDLLKAALSEQHDGSKVGISAEVIKLLKDLTAQSEVALPKNLNAQLRPYQLRGYEWMMKNTKLGFGSLIADDMGLGKTIQVITLLLKFKQEKAFEKSKGLIIVPTTLLTNWQKEIQRFAPDLQFHVYHGSKRKLEVDTPYDLLITTYGTARSDAAILKKKTWFCITIDEAQNIKNPDTEQTKVIKSFKADIKIAMSGTPVENRLSEFWSILDFTNKGYLGNLNKFTKEFAKPIQQEQDRKRLEIFQKITAPFLLRRVKTDKSIISDLPDKIENNHYTKLSSEQAALYASVVNQSLKDIKGNEGIARKGLVLKLMTALKQIGNHPRQYLGKGKKVMEASGKTQLLLSLLENIQEANEKVLIFTQYRAMGELLAEFINDKFGQEPLFLHGGISRRQRDVLVERFQKNRADSIFILSLKAGGTGLNLTQGNHVVHYDLWWNPAVENQATDRAFRIGQTKNVMVYRLINQGTMEEKIDAMIRSKKALADMSVGSGETWLGDLSNEDLGELVKLSK
jgi:SNF2 family DNA or RNA helicase